MTRLMVLTAWLLLIASPVAAQTGAPPVMPSLPPPTNSTSAPVTTVPPERVAPSRSPDSAGAVASPPAGSGPATMGITGSHAVAGSDSVNPQYGSSPGNPDRLTPAR